MNIAGRNYGCGGKEAQENSVKDHWWVNMLKSTFCHIPGVSAFTEEQLWLQGISSWEVFNQQPRPLLSAAKNRSAVQCLQESTEHLQQSNPHFFARLLPAKQHWRLFSQFRHSIAYLDIETTGLCRHNNAITTIALYDGANIRCYVQGKNLDAFKEDIKQYQLLVTYNGKSFDVPFIESYLQISLPQPHIDLMHVLRSLGFRGGLKGCEKQLGLARNGLEGVDGYFAVLLWREYAANGNEKALETLLAYNIEDAVNLEPLMVAAYNLKLKETPFFASHGVSSSPRPAIPFCPDHVTIERLKGQYIAVAERYSRF